MWNLPPMRDVVSDVAHKSAFALVAGSKTLYNAGAACLTIDTTAMALYCLTEYSHPKSTPSKSVEGLSIFFQIVAALFSTIVVVLSRYPSIWENLMIDNIKSKWGALCNEVEDCSRSRKILLSMIGGFGLLACVARGLSAYLGTEVILGERLMFTRTGMVICAWIAAITVTISSMCFNLVNMLTGGAKYLKKPTFNISPKVLVWFIGTISNAVAMRFFIKEYLKRRDASSSGQIFAQGVFLIAEFVMGLFTMGSSFEEGWQKKAGTIMKSSILFTFFVLGDAVTSWLGYHAISMYSILVDTFLAHPTDSTDTFCIVKHSRSDFDLRWTFVALSLLMGVPATFAYLNYLLEPTRKGYDKGKKIYNNCVSALKSPLLYCRFFAEERKPLLPTEGAYNMPDIQL